MPSWQRSIGHTVQYSNFRATVPSTIYVSQTAREQGPPHHSNNTHGVTVKQCEALGTYFDSQRRYDGYKRPHHVVVEEGASNDECEAGNSSDDFFDSDDFSDSDISDDSGRDDRSDDSDETAYAEAKGNTEGKVPRRPRFCYKTYKQEIKERGNAVKPPVNYYKTLGIQRDATEEEMKTAARKMRVQVRPHRLITAETSKEETKRINERAGEVGEAAASLLDYLTRQRHDEELQRRYWANAR